MSASRLSRGGVAVVLAMLAAAALGGCGNPPDPPELERANTAGEVSVGPYGLQSITLVSSDDYRFVPAEFTVEPGQVSVTLENAAAQLTHSLVYPPGRNPGEIAESIPVVAPSEVDTLEFTVSAPGEYVFICSFHESLGHTGVMTVEQ